MNEVAHTQPLSEQEIKDIMLRFLKRHYRNRQRNGETEIASDARGKGGILADGYLSFPKPGGGWFVATFEATSYETRQEVRFTQRRGLLFWDNLVVALWGTAIGGGFNITQQWLPIKKHGPALPLVMLFSVLLGLFFLIRMLVSHASALSSDLCSGAIQTIPRRRTMDCRGTRMFSTARTTRTS
jgi:hypothetical protein